MVKTRKSLQTNTNAGGRSGVVIEKTDGSNLDDWFDLAHSPEANAKKNKPNEESPSSSYSADNGNDNKKRFETNTKKKTPKKKTVKTPKHQVRMSLLAGSGEANTEDGSEEGRGSESVKRYASKLRKGRNRVGFTSPSDLSRVSTASLSPGNEERNNNDNDNDSNTEEGEKIQANDGESRTNHEDENESDIENDLLLTQDNVSHEEEDLAEEINDVVARQSAREGVGNLEVASPQVGVGVGFPADQDDSNDLGPPALPDEVSNAEDQEQEQEQEQRPETKNGNEDDIGGSDSDDENNGVIANNDYDDHDDDNEGPGFNMVHSPQTPLTVREKRAKKEMQKIRDERRKQRKENNLESESDKDKDNEDEDEDEADEDNKFTPNVEKGKKSKKQKKRGVVFSPKGIPIANRDYETVPIGALVEDSPDEEGTRTRRSTRARVKPLEFWRGEKMEYGAHNERGYIGKAFGDMPVVTGIQKALPTPYKKRKATKSTSVPKKSSKKNGIANARGTSSLTEEEFNSRNLRRKFKFHDGEEAYLWDDITDDTADQKVVAYASNMEGSELPISKKRKKAEGKITGEAAQAFNIPNDDNDDYVGYIMGNLFLPPKGIKDSESVGPCAQTFTVVRCQPKAFEVAYGDPDQPDGELDAETAQRFLLGPGDMFRVPPGNSYRLENHSEHNDCLLTWTIIRPRSVPTDRS